MSPMRDGIDAAGSLDAGIEKSRLRTNGELHPVGARAGGQFPRQRQLLFVYRIFPGKPNSEAAASMFVRLLR